MEDSEFDDILDEYLDGTVAPNLEFANVEIVWIENNLEVGALHIAAHGVTKDEVEEVLFELPPEVEAKRHKEYPDRTIFWGATRKGKWLFVVCEDWRDARVRFLKPITAFAPAEGRTYWDQQ